MSERIETPLHYCLGRKAGEVGGIVLAEYELKGHLILRGNTDEEQFCNAIEQVLIIALPVEPCTYKASGKASIYWLGPDEWLLITTYECVAIIETKLRQVLKGHYSIVDVSGGQTIINLSGHAVDKILKKSCTYDFHSENFVSGRCVQTNFGRATALVSKKQDGSFDLFIRRSFADYVAKWLLVAGEEYGCGWRIVNIV